VLINDTQLHYVSLYSLIEGRWHDYIGKKHCYIHWYLLPDWTFIRWRYERL